MPGAGSETMSASIGQSKMIGKQVYNPNATLVGTVADIGLVPGQKEITLQVRTAAGAIMDIKWEEISAVGDVVILSKEKEVPKMEVKPTPAAGAAPGGPCEAIRSSGSPRGPSGPTRGQVPPAFRDGREP